MPAYRAAGYEALIRRYDLEVIPNWHSSYVARETQVHKVEKEAHTVREFYPERYWPGEGAGERCVGVAEELAEDPVQVVLPQGSGRRRNRVASDLSSHHREPPGWVCVMWSVSVSGRPRRAADPVGRSLLVTPAGPSLTSDYKT